MSKLKEAVARKPSEYEDFTFFSRYDVWQYQMVNDDRLCVDCELYAQLEWYVGNDVRVRFPYLMIEDANVIHVNVHPNCRCYLLRVANPMDVRKYE